MAPVTIKYWLVCLWPNFDRPIHLNFHWILLSKEIGIDHWTLMVQSCHKAHLTTFNQTSIQVVPDQTIVNGAVWSGTSLFIIPTRDYSYIHVYCLKSPISTVSEPFSDQEPVFGYYANSVDLDQMPPNVVSDHGLHCLLTDISMQNAIKMKIWCRNP